MAEINETIVTGNIFRKLVDKKNNIWHKKSFWTKACDVEFDDGSMLEGKVGTIQSSLATLSSTVSRKNDGYDSSILQISTKLSGIEIKNASQDTRLSSLETSDSTQNTKISNLETKVSSIETNNSSQNTNVSNISTKVDLHDTKIGDLEAKIGNYSIKVMSLSSYNSLPAKESNVLYFCY